MLYAVERLPLLPGTYELSAAVYDRSCSHPYDHHQRRFPFRVRAGAVRERFGLVTLPAAWSHEPASAESHADGEASAGQERPVAV